MQTAVVQWRDVHRSAKNRYGRSQLRPRWARCRSMCAASAKASILRRSARSGWSWWWSSTHRSRRWVRHSEARSPTRPSGSIANQVLSRSAQDVVLVQVPVQHCVEAAPSQGHGRTRRPRRRCGPTARDRRAGSCPAARAPTVHRPRSAGAGRPGRAQPGGERAHPQPPSTLPRPRPRPANGPRGFPAAAPRARRRAQAAGRHPVRPRCPGLRTRNPPRRLGATASRRLGCRRRDAPARRPRHTRPARHRPARRTSEPSAPPTGEVAGPTSHAPPGRRGLARTLGPCPARSARLTAPITKPFVPCLSIHDGTNHPPERQSTSRTCARTGLRSCRQSRDASAVVEQCYLELVGHFQRWRRGITVAALRSPPRRALPP